MQWPSPALWWSPSVFVLRCWRLGLCWTIRSWLCRSDGIYDGHKLGFKAPAAEIFRNSILSRRGKSLMWFSIFWLTRDVISVNKIWVVSYFLSSSREFLPWPGSQIWIPVPGIVLITSTLASLASPGHLHQSYRLPRCGPISMISFSLKKLV